MTKEPAHEASGDVWTLRKAVTTLAIAPTNESLTRSARMAYNVMIFLAQRMNPDAEGGYSAPLSQILKGYDTTTRDSSRTVGYIDKMQTTLVRWFPLSPSDEAQAVIEGLDPAPPSSQDGEEGRTFTLLSEARYIRRSGERWVTYFFPPTIRSMIIEPTRWAQLDIKEMALLSHYAGVALFEICSRYKDVPGGLTNRAEPAWWVRALRSDPDTRPREWRKFKNETLRPALAEIKQRTSLSIELIEHKQGRAVHEVQFVVKRKPVEANVSAVDLSLVELAADVGIREKDLDALVDEFDEEKVRKILTNLQIRLRSHPSSPIHSPLAYAKRSLRNDGPSLLDEPEPGPALLKRPSPASSQLHTEVDAWVAQREAEVGAEVDALAEDELEHYAMLAQKALQSSGLLTPAMQKRFTAKQYQAPMLRHAIKSVYAIEKYGEDWKLPVKDGVKSDY